MTEEDKIRAGIAAYDYEQRVLLRLLRKRGQFTADEFDQWFRGREWRRPWWPSPISGNTFILGGFQHSMWSIWLDLLQHMIRLGMVGLNADAGKPITYLHIGSKES